MAYLWLRTSQPRGVDFRIAGTAMGAWISTMPDGMCLKSEGFATSLFEPTGTFTLGAYCAAEGIPYADTGVPVRKDTFVSLTVAPSSAGTCPLSRNAKRSP